MGYRGAGWALGRRSRRATPGPCRSRRPRSAASAAQRRTHLTRIARRIAGGGHSSAGPSGSPGRSAQSLQRHRLPGTRRHSRAPVQTGARRVRPGCRRTGSPMRPCPPAGCGAASRDRERGHRRCAIPQRCVVDGRMMPVMVESQRRSTVVPAGAAADHCGWGRRVGPWGARRT